MKWLLPLFIVCTALRATDEPRFKLDSLMQRKKEPQIIFNNRPLAKVAGKTISLLDVVKKMDVFLHQYYPQAFESKSALYQFYSTNWWPTLDEMINNELILQEAEGRELKVSDGDVREEMEERFGPNIMAKLHELNLGYEEARKMIHDEIAVRQMSYFKVHAIALQQTTPDLIKERYLAYCKENPTSDEWTYQTLSIRGASPTLAEKMAERAEQFLASGLHNLKETADLLQNEFQGVKVSLSDDISLDDKSLSQSHRSILSSLKEGQISEPKFQKNGRDKEGVLRFFYLKDHKEKHAKSFDEISLDLKDNLLRDLVDRHHREYIAKLRVKYHFDLDEMKAQIPADYQPFIIQS